MKKNFMTLAATAALAVTMFTSCAAENGGIKKVTQVEYVDQSILGGLFIKHTTRVYGE